MRSRSIFVPERGWCSLTVREETAKRIMEQAGARGVTVGALINELSALDLRGVWLTCSLCGTKIEAGNLPRHMAKIHPRTTRKWRES
ncbi:MAG: hypothetical protein ACUVUE_03685 [Candidatus Bathycorpusculaceae bacterium]